MRIGLTGGIGSGKSAVAAVWQGLGALIIDADRSSREAVAPGSSGLARIAERWPQVITPGGELDRAALGTIVFGDDVARLELEAIVHPTVRAIAIAREAQAGPDQPIVHMVPLLYEVGYDQRCDLTVLVAAPDAERIARVGRRDGLSPAEVQARISRQIDVDQARGLADFVIENDGTLAQLQTRASVLFERITSGRS